MSMKLSSEKKQFVLENQRLVHYLVQKMGVLPNSSEYEDITSIGTIGLIKAAITFDSSKKINFSTYASKCINNEIFMYYRKTKKYANEVPIDKPIGKDVEGNELTLEDIIEHPKSNFVEEIVNKEAFVQVVNIILNYLKEKDRLVILYRMGQVSQEDIAKSLNISQSYVSRIITKVINKIRKVTNHQVQYKEVFYMAIVGDEYRISFSSKDISKFNKIFATLLQNLTSTEKLPDFRVNCNRERIVVQIPAHPESFSFIAQIIQEIDDFSMAFGSDKSTLRTNNTVMQKVESNDADEKDDIVEDSESSAIVQNSEVNSDVVNETAEESETIEVIEEVATNTREQENHDSDTVDIAKETLVEESHVVKKSSASANREMTQIDKHNTTESNIGKTKRHTSQSKKVREFILALDRFSVKQVISNFPDVPVAIINNVIRLAKTKGLITCVARGEYVVNKT